MNIFGFSSLLAAICSVAFGLLVLFKSENKKIGRLWFLFSFCVSLWSVCCVFISCAHSPGAALLAWRVAGIFGVVAVTPLFYHFICVFCGLDRQALISAHYVVNLFFLVLLPSPMFISDVRWVFNSFYYLIPGGLYWAFATWYLMSIGFSHFELFRACKRTSQQKKYQIQHFVLATVIGFIGGGSLFLPVFGINVYPMGNFAICLYPLIMAYAIVRHQLMDIRLVVQKVVWVSIALVCGITAYITFVTHFTHRQVLPLANFSVFTGILSFAMGVFVLFKAPQKRITRVWALVCLAIACWSIGFGMMSRSVTFEKCIFWQTWFVYGGAILIPVVYLHFVSLLIGVDIRRVLQVSYLGAFVFEVINISGNLATAKNKPPFNYYTEAIFPIYHMFAAFFFVLAIYAHWLLLKTMKKTEGALKNQIQYVFTGTTIGFLGGCMTFALSFNIHIFPIGTYLVVFYLVAVTYAIYKHQLMDINVVLRKSLVYTLMTGVLTATYLIFMTQGTHFLQRIFGTSTLLTSVLAACAITAGFLPLRSRIQNFVDRYFFQDWSERGEMVREVAAGFSHELKSPLAGLSMQAQMTLAQLEEVEKDPAALKKALPRIKEELHYMVNKAMDAARRIEAVRGVAEPLGELIQPVDVCALLESSLMILSPLLKEVQVKVRRELAPGLPPVRGNVKQLEIVFINLMKNALEAMDRNDSNIAHVLTLCAFERDDMVAVSIKDTGAGIDDKDIDQLFQPYFTTKGRKGTGMGLFLAKQIVKAHKGVIQVQSRVGEGTEFLVKLDKYPSESLGGENQAA